MRIKVGVHLAGRWVQRMKFRHLVCALIVWFSFTAALPRDVCAQATTDPEKLKLAAEEFDAGRRAYRSGDFARAASHFENAYRDAPTPQALRMAIRSRDEAGDYARAATLCVLAFSMYPEEEETVQLAGWVLDQRAPQLQKVTVECEPACMVLLDGRLVRDYAATRQVIYSSVGTHSIVAGWSGNRSEVREIEGEAGGAMVVSFRAPAEERPVETPAPVVAEAPVVVESSGSGKASPVLFWLGAGVTTVFGGLTVWSGMDTLKNPGVETVREACVGRGTSCPEYQDGLNKQARTNYLLLSTGVGVASVTVIGLFFTDWGGDERRTERGAVTFSPIADPKEGVGMTATGHF